MNHYKKIILCVFIAASLTSVFAQNNRDVDITKAIQNLNRIENMYFKYLNKRERRDAIFLLNETRRLIISKSYYSKSHANLLSDNSYNRMLENVKKAMSDTDRTKIIQSIGINGKISCEQLECFISCFTFDSYKEDLIKWMANKIIDPVNIGLVIQHVDSSITRDNLFEYFKNRI